MNVSAEYYEWWFRYMYEERKEKKEGQSSLFKWIRPKLEKALGDGKNKKLGNMPLILWEGWVVWWDGKEEKVEVEHEDRMDAIIAWIHRTINEVLESGGTLLDWGWHML